jgi:peroxiredoxin
MRRYQRMERQRRRGLLLKIGGTVFAGIALLAIVFWANNGGSSGAKAGLAGQYRFDIADPATGALAPDFALPSTTGGSVRLSDFRGKTVLLYFHEGIGCEACWTQMKDIQTDLKDVQALGIDTMLTVTTNPLGALKQKVADERLTLPVLADESFTASRAYNATAYGMMAGSADGHTFILIGPDGRIRWRADYGGPPNYTMYVPVSNLIADIKAGTQATTPAST